MNSEVLEEPAADGSRGFFLWKLVIAFQEGMHLIVACDTRGLDLMTEKIIFVPESPLPYLVQEYEGSVMTGIENDAEVIAGKIDLTVLHKCQQCQGNAFREGVYGIFSNSISEKVTTRLDQGSIGIVFLYFR
ncbi:hypothetical protein TURU_162270 [Turdus rufiventris]|nr:hypothetical protein TURU_162270 [Turdus rufiventris]